MSSPIPRYLNVREILDQRSCLLFGPRQTGKSTLIRQQLDGLPVYNLLDQGLFLRLSRNPTLIREALTPESSAIVIDEIQRMPELLNEVHLMIEEHGIRFFLTGSSARSLRRRGVNLLGGRIRSRRLHPFVRTELGMANDAQVPVSTVREYYEILKDTLIAHEVPAFAETSKRKAISTAKYYLFDIGLARHLQGRSGLPPGTFEYGSAFESFVFQEIKAFCDYHRLDTPRYWRSKSNIEVDFLVGNIAVEVKAKRVVGKRDMRGLVALRDEGLFEGYIVVCMEPEPRTVDGIRIMPWANFLDELWGGKLTRR